MTNYMTKNIVSEHKLRAFVRILCSLGLTERAIHGIVAMVGDNIQAMTEVVDYIETNPTATEAQVIKVASQAIGIK